MNVLIATDGSPEATAASRTAMRLLKPGDRKVDLLCVAPRFARYGLRQEYERRILRQTTQALERARSAVGADVARLSLLTEVGSPAAVIVGKTEDYELTVIGPRGQGAAGQLGLGPVANRVVAHALGPVLLARELRSEGALRALIAVDGSSASRLAVETLQSLFEVNGAEICLMHVAETPWIHLGLDEEWETYDEEDKERSDAGTMEKELVREGDLIIEQARNLFRGEEVSVTTRMDEGNPADQILSEAERGQYDLIVIGATGTRDLKHSMLGSVSSKIAWNASDSVLIVRDND
jgi:nucleotide-binding universal stress UspA family protein